MKLATQPSRHLLLLVLQTMAPPPWASPSSLVSLHLPLQLHTAMMTQWMTHLPPNQVHQPERQCLPAQQMHRSKLSNRQLMPLLLLLLLPLLPCQSSRPC